MNVLRGMLIGLLVANVGYFFWTVGALAFLGAAPARLTEPETEPQRLGQQVRPELLRIGKEMPPVPPAAAAAEPPPAPSAAQPESER